MRSLIGCLLVLSMMGASMALAQIAGPNWRVASVGGAAVSDSSKTRFAMTADGNFTTSIGCNSMRGKAEIDGNTLAIGPLAATRMACEPSLMELEAAYEKALRDSRSFTLEGLSLVLRGGDGKPTVTFVTTR